MAMVAHVEVCVRFAYCLGIISTKNSNDLCFFLLVFIVKLVESIVVNCLI